MSTRSDVLNMENMGDMGNMGNMGNMADMTLIPCDVCREMIRFDEYEQHSLSCANVYMASAPILASFFPLMAHGFADLERRAMNAQVAQAQRSRAQHQENDEDEDEEDEEIDEEENEEEEEVANGTTAATQAQMSQLAQISQIFMTMTLGARMSLPMSLSMSRDDEHAFDEMVSELLGNVEVGIEDIDAISSVQDKCPPQQSKPSKSSSESCEPSESCAICQETIVYPRRTLNKCKHSFCGGCIETWLTRSKKCPLCMTHLDEA